MEHLLDLKSLSLVAKPKHLPIPVIEAIANKYSSIRDLPVRLWKLPIIAKRKNLSKHPLTNPTKYSVEAHKKEGLDVNIGYFVYLDKDTNSWVCNEHVFNTDDTGRVVECCKLPWNTSSYYVGMKVPKSDLDNYKFSMLFGRMSYIEKHSPRALFDLPKKVKIKEDEE